MVRKEQPEKIDWVTSWASDIPSCEQVRLVISVVIRCESTPSFGAGHYAQAILGKYTYALHYVYMNRLMKHGAPTMQFKAKSRNKLRSTFKKRSLQSKFLSSKLQFI